MKRQKNGRIKKKKMMNDIQHIMQGSQAFTHGLKSRNSFLKGTKCIKRNPNHE